MSTSVAFRQAAPSSQSGDKIRVMIVDDSVVIRGMISRWLQALPEVEIVARCRNGEDAVQTIKRKPADVVVLDIEMPVMDGLTALPKILEASPNTRVVMSSTLTRRNADISIKALALGATDYVPKPEAAEKGNAPEDFQRELAEKVLAIGEAARKKPRGRTFAAERTQARRSGVALAPEVKAPLTFQPASKAVPKVLAVGSSTGGPKALFELFSGLGSALDTVPVVVSQHMPATFTAILAEHISSATGRECTEGETGMPVVPGKIYIAPGGKHMLVEGSAAAPRILLDDGPRVNFCKPAVDPMLDSLMPVFGPNILVCILTGMGRDGCDGATRVQQSGGTVIAQDEASSVVWGMPGAVAQAGICHKVLPLGELPAAAARLIKGARG